MFLLSPIFGDSKVSWVLGNIFPLNKVIKLKLNYCLDGVALISLVGTLLFDVTLYGFTLGY